jgi:DNA-binding transcriptional ArsR family regulator
MVDHQQQLDLVFGAMADGTRRAILRKLGHGPARVTDVANGFRMSLNAVSKHLAVLERARLIHREQRGRDRICTLDVRALDDATKWIAQTRSYWETRLGALEEYVLAQRKARR